MVMKLICRNKRWTSSEGHKWKKEGYVEHIIWANWAQPIVTFKGKKQYLISENKAATNIGLLAQVEWSHLSFSKQQLPVALLESYQLLYFLSIYLACRFSKNACCTNSLEVHLSSLGCLIRLLLGCLHIMKYKKNILFVEGRSPGNKGDNKSKHHLVLAGTGPKGAPISPSISWHLFREASITQINHPGGLLTEKEN